jgi:hypothetical protein
MSDDRNMTGTGDALGERLLSGSATEFESSLLRAALEEAPSEALSAKMLAPLATGAVATAAVGGVGIFKWALSGAAVLVVGGAYYLGDAPVDSRVETSAPALKIEEPAPPPAAANEGQAPEMEVAPSVQSPSPREGVAEPTAPARASALPKKAASTLEEEMRLLDQVRSALRVRENPAEALRLLAVYEEKYPAGALRQEATVLRVSALKESGAELRADELKSEFLKENPKSAHKKQLESGQNSAK